jgi:cytochrome c oxidase assembly factor 1
MFARMQRSFLRHAIRTSTPCIARRTLIAAPKPGSGPLLERRSDRALPDISTQRSSPLLRSIPLFLIIIAASTAAIFNYQKSSSSVVQSTLYALRVSHAAREVLGEEIYFAGKVPWIWGSIDQLHGRVDISFKVKGTKGAGMMRFRSVRKPRKGYVSTTHSSFSLVNDDDDDWPCSCGRVVVHILLLTSVDSLRR